MLNVWIGWFCGRLFCEWCCYFVVGGGWFVCCCGVGVDVGFVFDVVGIDIVGVCGYWYWWCLCDFV